jgi:hypothetical protein
MGGTGEPGTAGHRHLRTGRLDLRPVDLADAAPG